MLRRFLLFSLLLSATLSLPGAALAQEAPSTTFTLVPALVDLKVDPGQSTSFTMTIYNKSDVSQPMKVYGRDFAAKGLEGEITFGDENPESYAASTWLTIPQSNIILEPKASQEIKIDVQVPQSAEPGGHYASVLFEQIVQDVFAQKDNSHVNLAARMAGLVYFTVSGDIREAGQVLGANGDDKCSAVVCGLEAPDFVDHGPVPFQFIFNNTGNVHVRPKGTITLYQFGRKVDTVTVDDKAVLPNAQRRFELLWQRHILIGPYTAKLHLTYGSKNYPVDLETKLWAFPWQWALGIVIVGLVVVGFVVLRKHNRVLKVKQELIKHLD